MKMIALPMGLGILRRLEFPHKIGLLDRIYGRLLSKHGRCLVNTYSGINWELNLGSASQRRTIYSEYLGIEFSRWARQWLRDGGTVIDVGANIGQTVMLFAACKDTKVIAIDPNPDCIAWIQHCLRNYPNWCVELVNNGLSDEPGELVLTIPDFGDEEGAQATLRSDWYQTRGRKQSSVAVTTLDDLLEVRGVTSVRLWKLDVEGWEHKVLEGARESFQNKRIDAVIAEVHPSNLDFFQNFMKQYGFDFYSNDADGQLKSLGDELPVASDYLVIRKELL